MPAHSQDLYAYTLPGPLCMYTSRTSMHVHSQDLYASCTLPGPLSIHTEMCHSSFAHTCSRSGIGSPDFSRSPFVSRFHAKYSPSLTSA